jgi:hypothetical protein
MPANLLVAGMARSYASKIFIVSQFKVLGSNTIPR